MGRPRKYQSSQERDDATREQKRLWYHRHKAVVCQRRRTSRRRVTMKQAYSNTLLCPRPHDPAALSDYIHDVLAISPSPYHSIGEACSFWRKFFSYVTEGDAHHWGRCIFKQLCSTPDDDPLLEAYEDLSADFEAISAQMRLLIDCAYEADPSARLGLYQEACSADKPVRNLSNIVGELVVLRREGVRSLAASEEDGTLIYQTL